MHCKLVNNEMKQFYNNKTILYLLQCCRLVGRLAGISVGLCHATGDERYCVGPEKTHNDTINYRKQYTLAVGAGLSVSVETTLTRIGVIRGAFLVSSLSLGN